MPFLSDYARQKKIRYFLQRIAKDARVLEIGCGGGWTQQYLKENGWTNYIGMDVVPPADIVGDITKWRQLDLQAESFDYIIAFEVVEHVDCFKECFELLKPGGEMMITTPLPSMDWVMKVLEIIGLNQKRTSEHNNLTWLKNVPYFTDKDIMLVGGLSQWGVLRKGN